MTWKKPQFLVVFLATASLAVALPAPAAQVLEKGQALQVRLSQPLDSETDQSGESFRALLDQPLVAEGLLLAPAGSVVLGELLEVRPSGKVKGKALMRMTLRSLTVEGETYFLTTNELEVRAEGSTKKDATLIGGGAGVGAIVGAIIGGKKGAAIGAAVGAGAGTAVVLVTDGKEIRFEEEQLFEFVLAEDLRLAVLGDAAQTAPGPDQEEEEKGAAEEVAHSASEKFEAARAEVAARVDELREVSARTLQRAREHVDEEDEQMSLESYFVLSAFDSSVDLFARLWEERDKTRLGGVKERLVSQLEQAESVVGKVDLPGDVAENWERVGDGTRQLDQLYDAFLESASQRDRRGSLRWWGQIDGSASIMLIGGDVSVHVLEGDPVSDASHSLSSALPQKAVDVQLRKLRGRGTVSLLERPSRWNDYRVVILIEDDQFGADGYVLELSWE